MTGMESREDPDGGAGQSGRPTRRRLRGSVGPGGRGLRAPSAEGLVWVMVVMGWLRGESKFSE